jgi:hypothetical protein
MNKKDQIYEDLKKVENYSQFISILTNYNLTSIDLIKESTLRPFQLKAFKKMFKGKEKNKKEWAKFKKLGGVSYYFIVEMSPHIAYCNKNQN